MGYSLAFGTANMPTARVTQTMTNTCVVGIDGGLGDESMIRVAVVGGRFPIPPLNDPRTVCHSLNAWVHPNQSAVPQASSVIEYGQVTDDELRTRLDDRIEDAVRYVGVGQGKRTTSVGENVGAE